MASPDWAALSSEAAPAAAPGLQFTDSRLAGAVQSQKLLQNSCPRRMQLQRALYARHALKGTVQVLLALNSASRTFDSQHDARSLLACTAQGQLCCCREWMCAT